MSSKKQKQPELAPSEIARVDRGLMESYADLGRQAIGSTNTDLTADKHGGPIERREKNQSEDDEKDDALGLRLVGIAFMICENFYNF